MIKNSNLKKFCYIKINPIKNIKCCKNNKNSFKQLNKETKK